MTTARYSIVVNGSPFGFFKGKCGVRQGGPMSSLIFRDLYGVPQTGWWA